MEVDIWWIVFLSSSERWGILLKVFSISFLRMDSALFLSSMMVGTADAVERRITQVHIARSHVDFRSQDVLAILELTRSHACEQVEVLVHGALPVRALPTRFVPATAILADLLRAQAVDVGQLLADELAREFVQALKVVGSEIQPVLPIKAEPANVLDDRIDVFGLLLGWIGIVET